MRDLIECIPNFSEGRNTETIEAIAAELRGVKTCRLLDVDCGESANRTVYTVVGPGPDLVEAVCRAVNVAIRLIDMRHHDGVHRCFGATDVVPFVPLGKDSMSECVRLARILATRIAQERHIPIYAYGHAALRTDRRSLAAIRRRGFDRLNAQMAQSTGIPDYGPAQPHPTAGATAIGARPVMIAYNVNLATDDVEIAKRIARAIRSRRPRINSPSRTFVEPLADCMADGWYIAEYGCAQVTMNLTQYRVTGLHHAYERVKQAASVEGTHVRGSEIVGLVPKEAMISAGLYYSASNSSGAPTQENDVIVVAEEALGLKAVRDFNPDKQILERIIASKFG